MKNSLNALINGGITLQYRICESCGEECYLLHENMRCYKCNKAKGLHSEPKWKQEIRDFVIDILDEYKSCEASAIANYSSGEMEKIELDELNDKINKYKLKLEEILGE